MRSQIEDMGELSEATDPAAAERIRQMRWGGAALAIGLILFVMGVVFGFRAFSGNWDTTVGATLPDTAALIEERWSSFRAIWLAELFGALFVATAAFLLQHRPQTRPRWVPDGVVWVVVGIASVVQAVGYALTLGSYPPALAAFAEEPTVFAALRGGVLSAFSIGSILQGLGLLTAMAIEFRWKGRELPDRLVQAGVGLVLLGPLGAALLPGLWIPATFYFGGALFGLAIWTRAGRL